MKIININALPEHVKKLAELRIHEFILDVVRPLETKYYALFCSRQLIDRHIMNIPIWRFEEACYENIAVLLHTIPICLLRLKKYDDDPHGVKDPLGAYCPGKKGNSPYIKLYLTEIYDASNNNDEFKWLFTKVLIHELAHAALDIFNWEHNNIKREKVTYRLKFGKWREESMANAIALRIIRDYGNKSFYNYAKKFMISQGLVGKEYALGVFMENFGYWDFRSVFDSKIYGVKPTLRNQWLKDVNNNPDWEGLHDWNNKILKNLSK